MPVKLAAYEVELKLTVGVATSVDSLLGGRISSDTDRERGVGGVLIGIG